MKFLFLKKRTVWVPTWLGGLLSLLLMTGTISVLIFNLHSSLAPNMPFKEGLLEVEGWLPDYAIEEAVEIYRSGTYEKIVTTGTKIEKGNILIKWKSYPQMTSDRLIEMGIDPSKIITVVGRDVRQDRTYASAMAMKEKLIAIGSTQTNIHLVSMGPHGLRSQLIYYKVLGKDYSVGITSLEDKRYEANRWWASSNGLRSVIGELIAYVYAKFLFFPTHE